ncbi:unnamed protein product [Bursaphelenchus okinawaensis]|uniref:Polyprotein allergen nematode domain-containing protein n=1 Tax=Bursaphelenchus okinawaensis TaxID=465554 RepID=A0A811L9C1_9BILA|nr:unnamed protein product [Bursaphelenchus okinawaensis]CAG9118688.1 unnamed protein product [Bursaphelenchus okinawaensis]
MEMNRGQRALILLLALAAGPSFAYDDVNDLPFVTTWLNEQARTTFTEKSNAERGEYLKSVYENLDTATKNEVHDNLLPECYSWFLTESQKEELEALHQSGDHERCHSRIAEIKKGLTTKQQENIDSYWALCEHAWYHENHEGEGHHDHHAHHHHRRSLHRHVRPVRHVHTSFDDFASEHLTWLSDAEKTDVKALHEGNDPHKSGTKIIELFKEATGEKKEKATAQLQSACKELIMNTVGEEATQELKKLKESGANHEDMSKKVDELIGSVTDEAKKTKAQRFKPLCEQVYLISGKSRKVRHSHGGKLNHKGHHGEHGLDDYLHTYLNWLTEAQKETLREMKFAGSSEEDLRNQVLDFYDHTTGDTRAEAQEALQDGCRTLIQGAIGETNAELLKNMKKEGSSNSEIYEKIQEMLGQISDKNKVERARKYAPTCKKAFEIASRKRRDHHHHELESKLKGVWSWLTAEQKDAIRELQKQGKKEDALLNKVFEYFKALTGKEKSEAEDGLQSSCGGPILAILGPQKAEDLKKFMETGSTPAAYEAKVKELLNANPSARKLSQTEENCKLVFTQANTRRRRHEHLDHHGKHSLEDYLKTHLSWLTDDQKENIRKLKTEGKSRDEIQTEVMKYYKESSGDQKEKATAQLQAGCRELLVAVIGKEKAEELKKLKEGGATVADVLSKAEELFKSAGESEISKQAQHYQAHCKEVFGLNRKRRSHGDSGHDHHHHELESKLKGVWSWLTEEQKSEIRQLKNQGKKDDALLNKVFEYFKALTGKERDEAEDGLQSSCGGPILTILGPQKAEDLKKFMEMGSKPEAYEAKVKELLNANPSSRKLSQTEENCKLVFTQAKRRRRHDHHANHNLEDYFKTHLSWLTDAQKDELRALKKDGKGKDEIQAKVMEFYGAATGETKEKATSQLQAGCRELLQHVIGAEKMVELKKYRESGKTLEEVSAKAYEFAAAVEENEHKKEAQKYTTQCKSLFGLSSRRRRHDLSFIAF